MGYMWVMMIPSMVFTRLKSNFSQEVLDKYKMDSVKNFSMVDGNNTNAVFPFVFVQLLPPRETGRDLEGDKITGGDFTFQIDVTDNKSQANARNVMAEIVRVMKLLRFEITTIPNYVDTKDTHRCIARFHRAIDEGDVI